MPAVTIEGSDHESLAVEITRPIQSADRAGVRCRF